MHCFDTVSAEKTGTFKKSERISSPADIRSLFKSGKKVSVPGAKLFFSTNSLNAAKERAARFAVTFPRGYGTAVKRNRSKRLCRESFRLQKTGILRGSDLLFLLYPCENETFELRRGQMRSLCKKAALIHGA